jgi:hypothetical protein
MDLKNVPKEELVGFLAIVVAVIMAVGWKIAF